jgi:DNA repair exonuclease SbcCD ATPase subunit
MGTNGIGKSALFDSLMWGFFGYTAQGQRGFQVAKTGADKVSVEIGFSRNEIPNLLKRTSRSKEMKLILNDQPASQEDVDRLIGQDKLGWLKSVYFSQGSTGFLDWTPAARMEFLQGYLMLEIWERMRVRLSAGRDRLKNAISATGGEESALDKAYDILASGLSEEDWGKRALELQGEMDFLGDIPPLFPDIRPECPERPSCEEENKLLGSLSARMEELETALGRFRNLKGSLCPLCGQSIDQETTKKEMDKLIRKLNFIQFYEQNVQNLIKENMKLYHLKLREYQKASVEYKQHEHEYVIACERREDLKRRLGEIGYMREQQEQIKNKLIKIKEEKKRINDERSRLSVSLDQYLFWISRIKPIQMSCVENFLTHLNFRIAGILPEIGMEDWKVLLKTTKTKVDSTVKPELSVWVGNREVEDVSWVSLSGGEKQRLRLAVLLALVPLFDTSFNIMIFDEPATGISSEGLDRLIEVLARMAQERGKIIFLIDHWLLESGHFSGRLWLTKTRDGTSIEQRN